MHLSSIQNDMLNDIQNTQKNEQNKLNDSLTEFEELEGKFKTLQ